MLAEVPDEHVPPRPGDARPADVGRRELRRQAVVQAHEVLEVVEHLRVARRVRAASGDDVTAVVAVLAGGSEELPFLRDGRADGLLQVGGVGS